MQPRWISGTFGASKELVPYDDCGSNRSAEEVTWCLHIWHPRLPIEVCLNGTGLYSISPLAHELGIANDVEYIKFCKSRDGVRGCLKIKYIRLFHFRAYISSTVNNAHCISQKFHQIFRVKSEQKIFALMFSFILAILLCFSCGYITMDGCSIPSQCQIWSGWRETDSRMPVCWDRYIYNLE